MKSPAKPPVMELNSMTNNTNESGVTETAPSTPADVHIPKIMTLAVHRDQDGKLIITPIDVDHDCDDLTELTEPEWKAKRILDGEFVAKQPAMNDALAALYELYNHRLYRSQFRTFENFCFAMYGTNRINDVLMKRIRQRVKALKADLKEEAQ
jgi:hypothetical protein